MVEIKHYFWKPKLIQNRRQEIKVIGRLKTNQVESGAWFVHFTKSHRKHDFTLGLVFEQWIGKEKSGLFSNWIDTYERKERTTMHIPVLISNNLGIFRQHTLKVG